MTSSAQPPSPGLSAPPAPSDSRSAAGMKPIRLVHCIGSLRVGGAEKQLAELIARLPADRFQQHLITLEPPVESVLTKRVREAGCPLIPLGITSSGTTPGRAAAAATALFRLRALLRRLRPHVAHAQLDVANILTVAAVRSLPRRERPAVLTSRVSLARDPQGRTLQQRMENRANRRADAVFANSRAVIKDVVQHEGLTEENLRLIYYGIDLSPFSGNPDPDPVARNHWQIPGDAIAVTVLANLHPYKGHADLLRAAAQLFPRFPNILLLLPGEDRGVLADLQRLARELGIDGRVRFLGPVAEIPSLLAAVDFVVHPSHEEGFSNALIEAMAAARALVATSVGGNPEAIVEGETGYLVPPRDPAALAAAMERLLEDPELRRRMGIAARLRAQYKYSAEEMIHRFVALYEELAAASPVQRGAQT